MTVLRTNDLKDGKDVGFGAATQAAKAAGYIFATVSEQRHALSAFSCHTARATDAIPRSATRSLKSDLPRFVRRVGTSGMIRQTLIALLCVLPWGVLSAQSTRGDLIFALNSALKSGNRRAVARCFNFEGTDETTRKSMVAIINHICSWPTHHVFTSERNGTGPLQTLRDGKPFTLNGDWTFQVHIFMRPPPSKGYVFPAGLVGNNCLILMMVPQK